MRVQHGLLALVLLLLATTSIAADGMTPRQVAELQQMSAAEISPDGSLIAVLRRVPRSLFEDKSGGSWTELHVIERATGESRPYITGKQGVANIDWLPDGSAISFLATRSEDEHKCLYLIPVGGGEAQRIVALDTGIRSYSWSPDAQRVAVIASEPEPEEREKNRKKGFNQIIFEEDWQPFRVWIAKREQGDAEPQPLPLEGSAFQVRWSPVGDQLAVALAPRPLVDDRYMFQQVHLIDLEGQVQAKIENHGKLGRISWSPDGAHVAMIAGVDLNDPSAGSLLVAGKDGGAPLNVTPDYQGSVNAIAWQDSKTIVVLAGEGVMTKIFRIQRDGSGMVQVGDPAAGVVLSSLSLAADSRTASALGSAPVHPTEVFAGELDRTFIRLTDSNPWLAEVALARQEVVTHTARDGLELEGLLIYPLAYEEGRRYPLVMIVHGGPEGHRRHGWLTRYSSPAQVLAARGFAVFFPNYRGSTGRGVAFTKLGQHDPAGKEFDDLVDAVDHLIEIGLVDPDKVGITGGSYGGYATAWCATHYSERFAAGVMFVGISNKISKTGTTDIPEEEFLVHALQRPVDDLPFYLERSPVSHVTKARTPLLIAHGMEDPRVNPGQSKEMYRGLKAAGKVPVRLVLYPGEGHGNRRGAAQYDYSLRLIRWMEHYLKGPGGEAPAYKLDYQSPAHGWDEAEEEED
jgi:dipeptidyl aminopeptidase/acylaminoacyl peptidase